MQAITFESANPRNYHQAITAPEAAPRVTLTGELRMPEGASPRAAVIIAPGSFGIAPSHRRHAETLCALGFATLVIDPFGPRAVTSTVANQTQYSFAASAFDVLAAQAWLAERADIDAMRIGAQGHSRGGTAVLTAAARRFAESVAPSVAPLRGVYAAYPWSGHQFIDADVGATQVRSIIGDRDEWCSAQQVQGHMQAICMRGGSASWRIVAGAQHSFDRDTAHETIEDASVSPGAPTAYMDDDGAFVHPVSGASDAGLMDRDLMVYALKAGYGRRGAIIGGTGEEAALFDADMSAFWQRVLTEALA